MKALFPSLFGFYLFCPTPVAYLNKITFKHGGIFEEPIFPLLQLSLKWPHSLAEKVIPVMDSYGLKWHLGIVVRAGEGDGKQVLSWDYLLLC